MIGLYLYYTRNPEKRQSAGTDSWELFWKFLAGYFGNPWGNEDYFDEMEVKKYIFIDLRIFKSYSRQSLLRNVDQELNC